MATDISPDDSLVRMRRRRAASASAAAAEGPEPVVNLEAENARLRAALKGLVDFIELDGLEMDDDAMKAALAALRWKR